MKATIEMTRCEAEKYALDCEYSNEELADEIRGGLEFHFESNGIRDAEIDIITTEN